MRSRPRLVPILVRAAFVSVVAFAVCYAAYLRPTGMRWGASDVEVATPFPGDRVVGNATFVATRALTVEAPPRAVWPWIARMAADEGRFVKGSEANRYMLWLTRSQPRQTWCWVLVPIDESRTRLVTRVRFRHAWMSWAFFRVLAADLSNSSAVRAAMEQVKAKAEASAGRGDGR
jgi:hypothetical protein